MAFPVLINSVRHIITAAEATLTLSNYLRRILNQTGSKIVCAEGDCGACTVLKSDATEESTTFQPINGCIIHTESRSVF